MTEVNKGQVNKEYKDRLFRFIFGAEENREYLLSLCNAIADTNYTDVEDIKITTLNDVLYVKMKNDISFLLGSQMNLFEHQSSFNPNMPLRGLQYFAELYGAYIKENDIKIYTSALQQIPTPRYVVFYNGIGNQPDVVKLKLSDAFQIPDKTGEFEWTATMLNINYGHNKDLMDKCRSLKEYTEFVSNVRRYTQEMNLKEAIDAAISKAENWQCIGSFLSKCQSEVSAMLLTEFNQKSYAKGLVVDAEIKMVKNLMDTMGLSLEKAMSALKIPEDHQRYIIPEFEKEN